jgi:UDP-N-acetylglucosamine 2-epimerase
MFLSLMAVADVLIGNSSAGLVETPLFNLPTINIGTRQQGRERGTNVIDVGYDTNKIYTVAKKIISHKKHNKSRKTKTPYKNRNTAKKVVDILITIPIDKKVLQKYGH